MTALSPRLAHLLIHEDRSTGRLLMPDGKVADKRRDTGDVLSPALSPISHELSPASIPVILPPPSFRQDRRASTSIFSLLNEARPVSPRQPTLPGILRHVQSQPFRSVPSSSPPYPSGNPTHYPSPRSATIRPASQESYTTRFVDRQPSVMLGPTPARPDMFRRHSAHPYDFSSSQSQYASASTDDFGGTSRAPISRTTKACNACRSRKVRCDAGGLPNGEPADCSRCREAGAECIYSGPQKKRGPCPGTIRQPNGTRSRRPSHRSSVTSIATQSVTTPPTDDELAWSDRSSYGFPPSGKLAEHRSEHPSRTSSVSVLSWPAMQPAIEIHEPKVVFRENYSMSGPRPDPKASTLPPLRVAIERRGSYYGPH